jgi:fucose 4-O-acetylase-like acetyltransferase
MERNDYWSIMKGLGILAVVLGHTGAPITKYVYMYHLALFFFISGFLYNEKYSADPFLYFGTRMKKLWWPMTKYGVIFALLHNMFLDLNVYTNQNIEGIMVSNYANIHGFMWMIKSVILMKELELIGGAMWFIQPLLFSLLFFCAIRHTALQKKFKRAELYVIILIFICFVLASYLIFNKITLEYYLDIALLVLPIIYSGFLAKKYWSSVHIRLDIGLLCLILLVFITNENTHIDLSQRRIINPIIFLLTSVLGIYINLVLAKFILKSKKINRIMVYIGQRSFHIMALHFLMFKLVNFTYVKLYNMQKFWIAKFPVLDSKWWFIYTLVGIFGSTLFIDFVTNVKKRILNN